MYYAYDRSERVYHLVSTTHHNISSTLPLQSSLRSLLTHQPTSRWTCVYPIYIDAKRPIGTGERRIARAKSVWWPLSKDIAEATNRLGLGTLHEASKTHPRDWENPGRVRVQWRKDGRLVNPAIKSSACIAYMLILCLNGLGCSCEWDCDCRETVARDDLFPDPTHQTR